MAMYKLQGLVVLLSRYRSTSFSSCSSSFVPRSRFTYPGHFQGQVLSRIHIPMAKNENVDRDADESSIPSSANDGKQAPPSPPPRPTLWFPIWMRWAAGSILSLLLSMWMPNVSTLLRIGGEAEMVMKEAEKVAETVEKIATMAEKVAEDMEDQFPDNTKLKEAAKLVENISKAAAKDAHFADEIVHKVDSVEHDLEDLEELVEPLIDKIIHEVDHEKKL